MLERIKKATDRSKKFVNDHKVEIAVVSTAYVCYKLTQVAADINKTQLNSLRDFVEKEGLSMKFYGFDIHAE